VGSGWSDRCESFQIYVEKVLLPTPKQGAIVIMDNLGSHKGKTVRAPKYSPDLNPIEQVFAKLKHLLRKASADPWTLFGLQSVSRSQPSRQRHAPTLRKRRIRLTLNSSRSSAPPTLLFCQYQ
jgi:transposase